ncbi:MAG TPA: YdcF family protein [Ignavibacteriaceae bacterium]|nr:YdcF family protein [Ignavibacteriaceae bacterium]
MILNQPLNKIFVSGLFCIYQFIQFILTVEIWLSIFRKPGYIFIHSFFDSVVITLILLVFAFFYSGINKNYDIEEYAYKNGIDVGVVLGAAVWTNEPSPSLKSRVDKAFNLYKIGEIQKIQLTGGNAPGELSEAEMAFKYLKTKNIDTNDVWIEKNTTSTSEQIQFINFRLMVKPQIRSVIVISDSYHLPRVKQIADFYHLNLRVASSNLDLRFENKIYYKMRESAAILIFWFFAI